MRKREERVGKDWRGGKRGGRGELGRRVVGRKWGGGMVDINRLRDCLGK